MTISATMSSSTAKSQRWESVVIGAGPAGSFAALRLAQSGRGVLLLDKKSFPREKVCGGCVGRDAIRLLAAAGLSAPLQALPQQVADGLHLHARGQTARLVIPPVSIISRGNFDAFLVREAIAAGAHFLPNTVVSVGDCNEGRRSVSCRHPHEERFDLEADFVIAADGLAHSSLSRMAGMHDRVALASRVGLGTIIADEDEWFSNIGMRRNAIQMVIGRQGYVGLACSQPGQLHVAAAISCGNPGERKRPSMVIADIFEDAGKPAWAERARQWADSNWCGTPPLTHRLQRVSADRLFVIGDAAAYVEPFTGEGISWALLAADKLSSLLADHRPGTSRDLELKWQGEYTRFLRHKSRACRVLASVLRMPRLAALTVYFLNTLPSCAELLVRLLNGSPAINGHKMT